MGWRDRRAANLLLLPTTGIEQVKSEKAANLGLLKLSITGR